jgi:nucleoside 2-deoxyribosyltransferase
VYLAGGIDKAPDGGVVWRDTVTPMIEAAGFDVFNPCVETDGKLAAHLGWDEFDHTKWMELKEDVQVYRHVSRWIVCADLQAVENSDVLLIYFDEYAGAGTFGEATLARNMGIPVYVVLKRGIDIKDLPAWFVGCATKIYLDENFHMAIEEM